MAFFPFSSFESWHLKITVSDHIYKVSFQLCICTLFFLSIKIMSVIDHSLQLLLLRKNFWTLLTCVDSLLTKYPWCIEIFWSSMWCHRFLDPIQQERAKTLVLSPWHPYKPQKLKDILSTGDPMRYWRALQSCVYCGTWLKREIIFSSHVHIIWIIYFHCMLWSKKRYFGPFTTPNWSNYMIHLTHLSKIALISF